MSLQYPRVILFQAYEFARVTMPEDWPSEGATRAGVIKNEIRRGYFKAIKPGVVCKAGGDVKILWRPNLNDRHGPLNQWGDGHEFLKTMKKDWTENRCEERNE